MLGMLGYTISLGSVTLRNIASMRMAHRKGGAYVADVTAGKWGQTVSVTEVGGRSSACRQTMVVDTYVVGWLVILSRQL
jgi:hypothetical protein